MHIVLSDHYPEIERVQGYIFFPERIEKITMDLDGYTKDAYKYTIVKIPDKGQKIIQDKIQFASDNKIDVAPTKDPSLLVSPPAPRQWVMVGRGRSLSVVPADGVARGWKVLFSGPKDDVLLKKDGLGYTLENIPKAQSL